MCCNVLQGNITSLPSHFIAFVYLHSCVWHSLHIQTTSLFAHSSFHRHVLDLKSAMHFYILADSDIC